MQIEEQKNWKKTLELKFQDEKYEILTGEKFARLSFNQLEVFHAFCPTTILDLIKGLKDATNDVRVSVIVLSSIVNKDKELQSSM